MRRAATAALLLSASLAVAQPAFLPPPPAAPGTARPALLQALLEHTRTTLVLRDGRLDGPGAGLIRGLAAPVQHVLLGEDHGNQGIAQFATALWRELQPLGWRHAAVESDPWTTATLETSLRAGGLPAWTRAADGSAAAAAFFTWGPEAAFAQAVVQSVPAPALWGLDQVFVGAAPALLARIAREAASPAARPLAAALADEARAQPLQALGRFDDARLRALAEALSDPADAALLTLAGDLWQSNRIYRGHAVEGVESWFGNDEREQLMRRLYRQAFEAAERRDGRPPKVMLKFGAWHLMRGMTPTMVQGFGGHVAELAAARGHAVLSILALCGPGGRAGSYAGTEQPCDAGLQAEWSFLAPLLSREQVTVFDLRPWRLRPGRLADLPLAVHRVVGSYDLLVFVPSTPGSAFLPGLALPR